MKTEAKMAWVCFGVAIAIAGIRIATAQPMPSAYMTLSGNQRVTSGTKSFLSPPAFNGFLSDGGTVTNTLASSMNDAGTVLSSTAGPMLIKSGVSDSATAVGFTLQTSNTLSNSAAKLLSLKNNGTEALNLDKFGNLNLLLNGGALINTNTAGTLELRGSMADGASAVGVLINTQSGYTTVGAKLFSAKTSGTEKFFADKDGSDWRGAATLRTCASALEGMLSRDVLAGVATGNRTRLCQCTSDGASSYAWQNVTSGTVGTTTTCPN